MARKVFYSFHFDNDVTRVQQIRNIGVIEGNTPVSVNDWETIKRGGDAAIQKWIDNQLDGRSCTIVLIGQNTAGRKWVNYEIKKSWDEGKGVLGIYIHHLKDIGGNQAFKGDNPFDYVTAKGWLSIYPLSDVVKAYNPPYVDSKQVYNDISKNMADWIEEALSIREEH